MMIQNCQIEGLIKDRFEEILKDLENDEFESSIIFFSSMMDDVWDDAKGNDFSPELVEEVLIPMRIGMRCFLRMAQEAQSEQN